MPELGRGGLSDRETPEGSERLAGGSAGRGGGWAVNGSALLARQRQPRGPRLNLCSLGPRDFTETQPELCLSASCEGMGQQ